MRLGYIIFLMTKGWKKKFFSQKKLEKHSFCPKRLETSFLVSVVTGILCTQFSWNRSFDFVYKMYTKTCRNVVYILCTFCIHQLYTSCTIFVYKMYTQFPCGIDELEKQLFIKETVEVD